MAKKVGKYWVAKVEAHCRKGCTVYEGCEDPSSVNQDASVNQLGASMSHDTAGASALPMAPTARIKMYDREKADLALLSATVKLQESLSRRRFQLRQRYANLYAARHGTDPAAVSAALQQRGAHGLSLESGFDPLEATTTAGLDLPNTETFPDECVPFLYLCAEHVLLLKDKMQSATKLILIRDWMPDNMLSVMAHGRLPEEGAFFFFFQLLQAVYFLHENRVAHRNVAAEHLHLTADGAVLRLGGLSSAVHIPDNTSASSLLEAPPPGSFGLCSQCDSPVPISAATPRSTSSAAPLANVNTLMTICPRCGVQQNRIELLRTLTGSPAYLAPEVLAYHPPASSLMSSLAPSMATTSTQMTTGSSVSLTLARRPALEAAQARDMWSCGVVLYFMLTATLPFDPAGQAAGPHPDLRRTPEQIDEMYARIVACQYDIPAFVSEPARNLITSLLQADPARRPTAAQAMSYPCLATARATLTAGM